MAQITTLEYDAAITSLSRHIDAKVRAYSPSLYFEFMPSDFLRNFTIDRVGEEGKFFGIVGSHKLTLNLLDKNRVLNLDETFSFEVDLGVKLPDETSEFMHFPTFYLSEIKRDEKTNSLTITAYDKLKKLDGLTFNDLGLIAPYTIRGVADAIAERMDTTVQVLNIDAFNTNYPEGANFAGTETLREVLAQITEATQTIGFINYENKLFFKRLTTDILPTIGSDNYFNFSTEEGKSLKAIAYANDLGDNVYEESTTIPTGEIQYVRNNGFWDGRDDIATLIHNAIVDVGGGYFTPCQLEWRGNPAFEMGDRLLVEMKTGGYAPCFIINDSITYNGGLKETTSWKYEERDDETPSNPISLGDKLTQTFAKVDKAAGRIQLVASEVDDVKTNIVELQQDAYGLDIKISNIETNGVSQINTGMGYTFNDQGLKIKKSDSNLSTHIDEDGMRVLNNDEVLLEANSQGIDAKNLHASTYLVIGKYSRFEDYDLNDAPYTACFWIGRDDD